MADQIPKTVVITDANVLINLCHIVQIPLLKQLTSFCFVVPQEVIAELTDPMQQQAIADAMAQGYIKEFRLNNTESLELFSKLRTQMGAGEAACLAAAATASEKHLVASDEKKIFKRKAIELLGDNSLMRTEDLIICGIQSGLLSVPQADAFKAV
ncbi:hypothetical protein GTP44_25840 [Duganella sp. FT50W]|uniref:PIN domain-containing protein n=1 Tax=Duganella lactea TaxID=2692173 RepID=A0A6L8MTD9_9BURK|nr:hypothetical protein [Duganella lactea]MYM85345.1 hypothetical protein [Duganella lactea]